MDITNYMIDLTLKPTTFDLWHVCLAGTAVILAVALIFTLMSLLICLVSRKDSANKEPQIKIIEKMVQSEPVIKIVEKIVEVPVERIVEVEKIVEKIVQTPAPAPVVLKEANPDAALQLLYLLQNDARFIDFIKEDMSAHSDEDVGMVARVIHEGCNKVLDEHFTFISIAKENEGDKITLLEGFDAAKVRVTGNIVGNPPFTGTIIHKGWQITDVRLPSTVQGYNANVIAPAEVEL
ncbi:MAG: DUF2760 domain-containing protein [Methylococcaceae bacterium]|nr:DUF2760 domain-containing protein [Methylococcaceae bacterium]